MADVTIKYKGATIAKMSGTSEKTLKTGGTYCEGDISVNYDKIPESEILGDTGFLSLSYIDVTIGANTVSLGDAAIAYLNELAGGYLCAAALLTNPTTQNQLILSPGAMTHPSSSTYKDMRLGYRYRTDGTSQPQALNKDWAFVLKQGSKYRLWVCNLNTTNLKPY